MVTVIFPAAGVGRRMGAGRNKALISLCGKPILVRTMLAFSGCDKVDDFIVAVGEEEVNEVSRLLDKTPGLKPFRVVAGGAERQYSVQNALTALYGGDANFWLAEDVGIVITYSCYVNLRFSVYAEKGALSE